MITRQVRRAPSAGAAGDIVMALGLAAIPAVSLGFARFAYALILPAMQASLHWSFAAAGLLTTANAVGYLVGALATSSVAARLGERTTLLGSAVVTSVSLAASAASGNMAYLLALRFIAGAAGAVAFIVGGVLATRLGAHASARRAALLLGLYFAGGGIGIAISGAAVPALLSIFQWQVAWLLLGALALAVIPACLPGIGKAAPHSPAASAGQRDRWPARSLLALLISYGLFGAGYITYMTFIVAYLRQRGTGDAEVIGFWILLGTAAALAGFGWSPILGRLTGGRGSALLMSTVTVGAILPLVSDSSSAAYASALLFGASFLSVITAVTTCARQSLPAQHWTAAIAGLTSIFAVGQCLGPVLAGTLSDGPNGMRAGLAIGAAVLAAGALAALAQRSRDSARRCSRRKSRPSGF